MDSSYHCGLLVRGTSEGSPGLQADNILLHRGHWSNIVLLVADRYAADILHGECCKQDRV